MQISKSEESTNPESTEFRGAGLEGRLLLIRHLDLNPPRPTPEELALILEKNQYCPGLQSEACGAQGPALRSCFCPRL